MVPVNAMHAWVYNMGGTNSIASSKAIFAQALSIGIPEYLERKNRTERARYIAMHTIRRQDVRRA